MCCRRTSRQEFLDFLRTCPGGNLKIRADLERHGSTAHSGYKTCVLHCYHDRWLNADKNVNQLESRKFSTTPGCDAEPQRPSAPGSTVPVLLAYEPSWEWRFLATTTTTQLTTFWLYHIIYQTAVFHEKHRGFWFKQDFLHIAWADMVLVTARFESQCLNARKGA